MTKRHKQNTIVYIVLAVLFTLTLVTIAADQAVQYNQVKQSYLPATPTPTPALKAFKNDFIKIKYPSALTATPTSNGVRLTHSLAYNHPDFCDLKGSAIIDQLVDFDLTISVADPPKDLLDFQSIIIDGVEAKVLEQSVEGCGQTIYYFPDRNLTLINKLVGVPSDLNLAGIITPDQSKSYLSVIISDILSSSLGNSRSE